MSAQEQESLKQKYYAESLRYMDNAKETLQKAGKKDNYYLDDKYVKTACGIAYNGVLKALDGYLKLKSVEVPRKRKSIEFYQDSLSKINKKINTHLHGAYEILHLAGYYDGFCNVKVIQEGFSEAYNIIDYIKPINA